MRVCSAGNDESVIRWYIKIQVRKYTHNFGPTRNGCEKCNTKSSGKNSRTCMRPCDFSAELLGLHEIEESQTGTI